MYMMLEDLLKYVTVENKLEKISYIDSKEIINQIIDRHAEKINENNISFDIKTLPKVKIRPMHFNILIENLILNSIKFRHPERELILTISGFKKDNSVYFKVSDNGIGIKPDHHSSVFQIFRRLNNKKKDSTGIGLSLCKKITETYNGNIKVISNEDFGCSFIINIPDFKQELVGPKQAISVA